MSRFVIAFAVTWLGPVGCHDTQLDELQAIKEEVCACKTSTCGETAMQKIPQSEIKTNRKMQQVARLMMDCMKRLYDRERPTTDPDAEPEPADVTSPGSAAPSSAKTP